MTLPHPEQGPLALVGSGEYLPVMQDVEAMLLLGRAPRYVQLATAAAPEGDPSLARWHALGLAQAERLDVQQVVLDVRSRADADDPSLAALIAGAGLVYLSGGSPQFLAETLRGTAVWAAIETAWRSGAALAGCSAGAMAMTGWVPAMRDLGRHPDPGLGLLPHLRVIPHFDRMLGWVPDIVTRAMLRAPEGVTVLGIDEDTALVGGPEEWVVRGRQSVWVLGDGPRTEHVAGTALVTPLSSP
ncbi:MAG TPA: Type 1 glutamine amidotransferase-like domain-containing protein [Candidatus Limnocylindria bacterium]|nr:Type 1 glutamine amidotransferase-like domain-containing protein [Candidatus Limnocylindria bacterium]